MRILQLFVLAAAVAARAEVRLFVQEIRGLALTNYECTAGDVARAFALDVRVDRGQTVGFSQFFRGESRAGSSGVTLDLGALAESLPT